MNIAVIIAARDAEVHLGRALDSIAAQTKAPREVIVTDDASLDGTPDLAEQHDVVTMVVRRDRPGGPAAARNAAAMRATSTVLAFLDADDWWEEDYLEAQASVLRRHHIGLSGYYWHRAGRKLPIPPAPDQVVTSALTIGRQDFMSLEGFSSGGSPEWQEERALVRTAAGKGLSIGRVHRALVHYAPPPDSITRTRQKTY